MGQTPSRTLIALLAALGLGELSSARPAMVADLVSQSLSSKSL